MYAFDLADRVDRLSDDDGQARENLPDSDAQDWAAGAVPAAAGSFLVVLTRILDISQDNPSGPHPTRGTVTVTVEMRAVDPSDPAGTPVFYKKAKGHASACPNFYLIFYHHITTTQHSFIAYVTVFFCIVIKCITANYASGLYHNIVSDNGKVE